MGWGFFTHINLRSSLSALIAIVLGSQLCACDNLKSSDALINYTFNISSFSPQQGYGSISQVMNFYGTNLTAQDVVTVGETICSPITAAITSTFYQCTLPRLCFSQGGCSAVGTALTVTYTQARQAMPMLQTYSVVSYAPDSILSVDYIGVHSAASESIDLLARYISSEGGQLIDFQLSAPPPSPLESITIGAPAAPPPATGGPYPISCINIQADPKGNNYYQCQTLPVPTVLNSATPNTTVVTNAYSQINFNFADTSTIVVPNSIVVIATSVSQTEAAVQICSNPAVIGYANDLVSNHPTTYDSAVSPFAPPATVCSTP